MTVNQYYPRPLVTYLKMRSSSASPASGLHCYCSTFAFQWTLEPELADEHQVASTDSGAGDLPGMIGANIEIGLTE